MELQVLKLIFTAFAVASLSAVIRALDNLIWRPRRLRSKLREQGIRGPPGSFLVGNLPEIKKLRSNSTAPSISPSREDQQAIKHNYSSKISPFLDRWRQQYGTVFTFSIGNIQMLYVNDVEAVRQISTRTSLDFGKPYFQLKLMDPMLGQGIANSNGAKWAQQKKILAPEFYVDKVKGMINLMVESSIALVNSWREKIEEEGGVADINVDSHVRSFSGDVISKACFGSNYAKGQEIFLKLRALEGAISNLAFTSAIPCFRKPSRSDRSYDPHALSRRHGSFLQENSYSRTGIPADQEQQRNTEAGEREIQSLILKVVEERKEATSEKVDLLQMILEGATNSGELGSGDATDRFVVDNCKNIYFAGYETTAVTAAWMLMLLASEPGWQAKVREEVMQLLGGGLLLPDADMIRRMKTLTMVINESLRLYPPVAIVTREALEDLKFGNIQVPKGVNVWTHVVPLHHDPEIWGLDADRFNPERFANGVIGACNLPFAYMPFGVGSRSCLGQNFAIAELKVLLALIISNFSLSISPKYRHSPTLRLVIEPEFGVDLLVRKL